MLLCRAQTTPWWHCFSPWDVQRLSWYSARGWRQKRPNGGLDGWWSTPFWQPIPPHQWPSGARFVCLSHVGGVGLCEMPDCFVMKWPISPVWWAVQGARGRTSARVLSPISSSAVPSPYLSFKQNSFHWLSWVPWGLIVVYKGLWNPKWSMLWVCVWLGAACPAWAPLRGLSEQTSSFGSEWQTLGNYAKVLWVGLFILFFFLKFSANGSIVSCKGFSHFCYGVCDIHSTLCSISKVIWESLLSFGDFTACCLTSMWLDPGKIS